MATISGDTGEDPRPPYGVLGVGVNGSFITQGGDTQIIKAVGVYGLTGNRSDISNEIEDLNENMDLVINAAVAGALPTSNPSSFGTGAYEAFGFLAGKNPFADGDIGAFGQSDGTGVVGIANKATGTGVYGGSVGGVATGVTGETTTGVAGVLGRSFGPGKAGKFEGDVEVTGDIRLVNQDLAEEFDIRETAGVEPGSVMVFDSDAKLHPCRQAYDKKVAGVIAGAGECKPAIVLGKLPSLQGRLPIALVGTAYCKVDAEYGSIEVGDPLTTSATPGHAMKACDSVSAFGAVVGKAMRRLEHGRGCIPIFVALQ